jgi:hypothetical protein
MPSPQGSKYQWIDLTKLKRCVGRLCVVIPESALVNLFGEPLMTSKNHLIVSVCRGEVTTGRLGANKRRDIEQMIQRGIIKFPTARANDTSRRMGHCSIMSHPMHLLCTRQIKRRSRMEVDAGINTNMKTVTTSTSMSGLAMGLVMSVAEALLGIVNNVLLCLLQLPERQPIISSSWTSSIAHYNA